MPLFNRLLASALLLVATASWATDHGSVNRTIEPPLPNLVTNPVTVQLPENSPLETPNARLPWIAIIIDDLGYQQDDRQAVLLPGPVACSFLPHTPYAVELANMAAQLDKEVMLHQPMESTTGNNLGSGALTLAMDETSFRNTLNSNLASLPHVSGVNNHMGSLLTSHNQPMNWLMTELRRHESLFFIDSRTTRQTVALNIATDYQLPSSLRDVFLDNQPEPSQVLAQFELLIKKARQQGSAIAIGHPYPTTLAMLETQLPSLEARGITLKPVEAIIKRRQQQKLQTAWHQ